MDPQQDNENWKNLLLHNSILPKIIITVTLLINLSVIIDHYLHFWDNLSLIHLAKKI